MLEQLKQSFSEKRMSTYVNIAHEKSLDEEYAVELYKINILICEELYAFISCIEVCLRNRIHNKMIELTNNENWFDTITWLDIHKKGLVEAKKPKYNGEPAPSSNDIISRLNFGFWCHIFDASYEQALWVPCLRFIFPNYIGKPNRKHVAKAFKDLLIIRNRIAHFEPVIKNEANLLKIYNQMVEVMNWMCPDVYSWFETFNKFKELYKKLKENSFANEENKK